MDDLFEFLIELVLEGTYKASRSKRIPKGWRLILLAVPFILCIGLLVLIAYQCFLNATAWLGAVCALLALAALIGYIVLAYRIIKEIPRKKDPVGNENADED